MAKYYADLNPFASPIEEERFRQAMESNPLQDWNGASALFEDSTAALDQAGIQPFPGYSQEEQARIQMEQAARDEEAARAEQEARELEKEKRKAAEMAAVRKLAGEEDPDMPEEYAVDEDPYDLDRVLAHASGEEAPQEMSFSEAEDAASQGDQPLDPYDPANMTPEQRAQEEASKLSDEDLAWRLLQAEKEKEHKAASMEEARLKAQAEEMTKDQDIWAKAMERTQADSQKLYSEMEELSKKEIDPKRWASNLHAGQKIALSISALIDGQMSLKTGRANETFALIDKEIERDIEAQVQSLGHQRAGLQARAGMVQDIYSRTNSIHVAKGVARDALYANMQEQNRQRMAQYDPKGTQYLQRAQLDREIAGKRAAAQAKTQADLAKANLDWAKHDLERQKFALEIGKDDRVARKDLRDELSWEAGARGWKRFAPERDAQGNLTGGMKPIQGSGGGGMLSSDWEIYMGLEPGSIGSVLGSGKLTRAQVTQLLDARKKYGPAANAMTPEQIAKDRINKSGPDGNPLALGDTNGKAYRQGKNGEDGVFTPAPEDRAKLQAINNASKNIRRLVDAGKALRAVEGGESEILASPEYQRYMNISKSIDFETYKAFDLGAPSAGDQAMATGVRGGVALHSYFRDATTGLEAYAQGVEDKFNAEMRSAGYTGPTIRHPRGSVVTPTEEKQEALEASIRNPVPPIFRGNPEQEEKYLRRAARDARRVDPVDRSDDYMGRLAEDVPRDIPEEARLKIQAPLILNNKSEVARGNSIRDAMGVKGLSRKAQEALAKNPAFVEKAKKLEKALADEGYNGKDIFPLIFGGKSRKDVTGFDPAKTKVEKKSGPGFIQPWKKVD